MKTITRILAAAACVLPLAALAQTPPAKTVVSPPDAQRSRLERDDAPSTDQATKDGKPATAKGSNKADAATRNSANGGAIVNSTPSGDASTNGASAPSTSASASPTTPTSKNTGK